MFVIISRLVVVNQKEVNYYRLEAIAKGFKESSGRCYHGNFQNINIP